MARWSVVFLLALAAPVAAAPVPKAGLTPALEAEFDRLWDAIGSGYSVAPAVHLYCRMVANSDAAVEYLTKHLPPTAMTKDEAKQLLTALASEKAETWKPAFRALAIRDVRLALTITAAWEENDSETYRQRLGPLLIGRTTSPEAIPARVKYTLKDTHEPAARYSILVVPAEGRSESYGVNETFERAEKSNEYRGTWVRMAVGVLERSGNPAARSHLKALAGGHEESLCRMTAKDALARLDFATVPRSWKLTDLWRRPNGEFDTPDTINGLLDSPKETVAFLKEKLKPLTLSKKDGQKLLARLFSDDPKEMQAAMKEMQYFDLRLAMSVEEAWADADSATRRCRLVEALNLKTVMNDDFSGVDQSYERLDYAFQPPDSSYPDWWYVRSRLRNGSKVSMLGVGGSSKVDNTLQELNSYGNIRWFREESAIYILDVIGTDEAIAVIKDMATGHPDAGPTKAAKEVFKRRGIK